VPAKLLFCVIFCLSASAAWRGWTSQGSAPQDARPAISLERTSQQMDITSERPVWEFAFPIKNTGSRRLILNELDLSCGCGEQIRQTIIISPGETEELTVTLDTRATMGRPEVIARYLTNDPSLPQFDLTVRATVGGVLGNGDTNSHDDF
jgi:hypothetical protein